MIGFALDLGGAVCAMIFLLIVFTGALLRAWQPLIEWARGPVLEALSDRRVSFVESRRDHALLYDGECGFCRLAVKAVMRLDEDDRLRAVSIQSEEGQRLLTEVPAERRLDTLHLVTPGGHVLSGPDAAAPLSRLLKGGHVPSRAMRRFPDPDGEGLRVRLPPPEDARQGSGCAPGRSTSDLRRDNRPMTGAEEHRLSRSEQSSPPPGSLLPASRDVVRTLRRPGTRC